MSKLEIWEAWKQDYKGSFIGNKAHGWYGITVNHVIQHSPDKPVCMAWVSLIAGMEYGMDYGMDDQNQKNLFCRLGSPALPGISYAGYNSA